MTAKEKLNMIIENMTEEQSNALLEILNMNIPQERHACPCCGNYTLVGSIEDIAYDVCDVCFWEYDSCENDEDESGCNHMTLGQARENYRKFGACDEKSVDSVRLPEYYELPEYNE